MNDTTDFWIDTYDNRRWWNTFWTIVFGIITAFCLGLWVFDGSLTILLAAVLEYLCFLGFIQFAFSDTLALEAERKRQ